MNKLIIILLIAFLLAAGTAVAAETSMGTVMRLKANQSGDVLCIGLVDEILIDPYEGGVQITCRVYVK